MQNSSWSGTPRGAPCSSAACLLPCRCTRTLHGCRGPCHCGGCQGLAPSAAADWQQGVAGGLEGCIVADAQDLAASASCCSATRAAAAAAGTQVSLVLELLCFMPTCSILTPAAAAAGQLAEQFCHPALVVFIQCCIHLIQQQQPAGAPCAACSQQEGQRHQGTLPA